MMMHNNYLYVQYRAVDRRGLKTAKWLFVCAVSEGDKKREALYMLPTVAINDI